MSSSRIPSEIHTADFLQRENLCPCVRNQKGKGRAGNSGVCAPGALQPAPDKGRLGLTGEGRGEWEHEARGLSGSEHVCCQSQDNSNRPGIWVLMGSHLH